MNTKYIRYYKSPGSDVVSFKMFVGLLAEFNRIKICFVFLKSSVNVQKRDHLVLLCTSINDAFSCKFYKQNSQSQVTQVFPIRLLTAFGNVSLIAKIFIALNFHIKKRREKIRTSFCELFSEGNHRRRAPRFIAYGINLNSSGVVTCNS